jgi:CheY-like chemotaxis protein
VARVLVVDDEAPIRANLGRFLRLRGHEVEELANGADAVDRARRTPPELILCDVAMPGTDGLQVLAAIRADPALRAVPFVFVSASADAADRQRGLDAGANGYVTKPFNLAALGELVDAFVAR